MRVASEQNQARESRFVAAAIDPLARQIVDAAEPWAAYDAALSIPGALLDALDWMPHGAIYNAWQELTDLFETGKTPLPDAHAALRHAATEWLARPGEPTEALLDCWLEQTQASTARLFRRDGDFWTPRL